MYWNRQTWIVAIAVAVVVASTILPAHAADNFIPKTGLPEELLDKVYPYYRFQGVSQHEAEALFGDAIAAIYYPERGEVRILSSDNLSFAETWLREKRARVKRDDFTKVAPDLDIRTKVHSTASMTLRDFLEPPPGKAGFGRKTDGELYLAKAPVIKRGEDMPPETEQTKKIVPKKGTKDYYYIYDDFEGDVWANWSRSDNTSGQYTWGARSCDAYYSSYSADAPRGGSQGASLGCTSSYPRSLETYMYFEACQSIPSNWLAYLEFQFTESIDRDGDDFFSVLFEDSQGSKWGWYFWGTLEGWYQNVFNLRQWYGIGDLGVNTCNTLYLGFESDSLAGSGYGARVDDLYVYYGDTTGSYECAIVADPNSGESPLTVAFRATTDMYDPYFYWWFADGESSEEMDPVHLYAAAGDYRATLGVYDDYGTACYASTTISVSQGTCTYSISPSTASYDASGGSGDISVSATAGCPWNASSSRNWITITDGSSGTGSGSVSYSVNPNSTTSQRSGTITAGGKAFTITQAGAASCTYSISPTNQSFDADGGTGSVSISTNDGCTWTAIADELWITITSGEDRIGNGTTRYRVNANSNVSGRTGTMTIAGKTFTVTQDGATQPPGGSDNRYLAVGVIHSKGAAGSDWRSTLALCNPNPAPADVVMVYRGNKGEQVTRTSTIPTRGIRDWDDAVRSLFGIGSNSSGVVDIESSQPLEVSVRTYNYTVSGTFGQMLPGIAASDSLTSGTTATLSPLRRTDEFRTNIGVINTGEVSCSVLVSFISETGEGIGSDVRFDVEPGEWKQINDTLGKAGLGEVDCAYALVEVSPAGATAWAYASVIDNLSNDPTAVLVAAP